MRQAFDRRVTVAIAIFAVLLVLFFNFSQWYLYFQMKRFLESRVRTEVKQVAEATASRLDPFTIEDIVSSEHEIRNVATLSRTLSDIKKVSGLIEMSVYDLDGVNVLSVPTDTIDWQPAVLNLAEFTSATAGITSATEILRSDSLYLVSAFAPVFDYDDEVIAVVHSEGGYTLFRPLENFRQNVVLMNIGSLLFMLLFVLLFYLVNRRILLANQAILRASAISSMGEMAATIAHEIRNPLGIIKNSAERIRKKYGDKDDPVFDFIGEEVDRLNSIVAGYLDFAHPAEGRREKFSIVELTEDLVRKTRTDFDKAGIEVDFESEISAADGNLPGDKFAIRQALLNLMINARDAQTGGGSLRVRVTDADIKGRDAIRLRFEDQGPGIPGKIAERAFEPFFTTRSQGSGLGLYIAKSVVDSHGGTIRIESGEDRGASIEVVLPRGI